jgi:hypothetical protein
MFDGWVRARRRVEAWSVDSMRSSSTCSLRQPGCLGKAWLASLPDLLWGGLLTARRVFTAGSHSWPFVQRAMHVPITTQ